MKACVDEYEALEVKALAIAAPCSLPAKSTASRNCQLAGEALGLLMSVMLAPIGKMVRTLNEVPGQLVPHLGSGRRSQEGATGLPSGRWRGTGRATGWR